MEANTILIVEDDAGLSELLSEKAQESGYQTFCVISASNAIEWLKKHTPFIMILDYSLPDLNGKELITELMASGQEVPPFIVSTGQGDERIAVEMMKLGARDYIIKDNYFLDMIPSVIHKVSCAIVNENKLKLAEQSLIETVTELKRSQRIAQIGNWKINLLTNDFTASDEGLHLFGFPKDSHPRFKEVSDCIHPDDIDKLSELLKHTLLSKEKYEVELRIFRKDTGESINILSIGEVECGPNGEPIAIIGTNQDITVRKLVEESIKISNASLLREKQEKDALINSTKDLIWSVDKNLNLVAANQEFLNSTIAFTGGILDIGDYLLKDSLFSNELILFWKDLYEKVLRGDTIEREFYTPSTNNSDASWLELNLNPIYLETDIIGIACFGRTITERKLAVDALQKSEEKYRYLFANNPQPMWIYDLETLAFLEVNVAAINHYGYSRDEFMQMTLKDIRPAEDILLLVENIKMVSAAQNPMHVSRHTKKNGEIIYVEITAHPVLFNGRNARHILINDITNRTMAEKQLKLLSKTVEQSPVTVVITDKNGNIEYANPKFTETTGYTLEEVKGQNPRVLKSGTQTREYYEKLWNTILSGEEWTGEFHNKKKNGESYWEKAVISSIVNNKGEIDYFLAVKEDITERKKMFEELIQAKKRAEESDRLKSAFLANMSHEIRTPMNGILGFAGLLKESDLDDQQREDYLNIIEQCGERMLCTINNIVDISKIEAGQVRVSSSETCVNTITTNIHHFFRQEIAQKGLQMYCKNTILTNEPIVIKTDKDKLHFILLNLVKNAIKFTETGSIEIGYGSSSSPTQDVINESGSDELLFYVKDTGIGIQVEQKEFIFERFRQGSESLNKKYEGAGLGLSISKAYVEMLGGRIWVESEEGKGSSFYFTLPYPTNGNGELLHENLPHVFVEEKKGRIASLKYEEPEFDVSSLSAKVDTLEH